MTAHASKGWKRRSCSSSTAAANPSSTATCAVDAVQRPTRGWHGDGFLWRAGSGRANSFSAKLADEANAGRAGIPALALCRHDPRRGPADRLRLSWQARPGRQLAPVVQKTLCKSPHTEIQHPATNETVLRYQVTPRCSSGPDKPERPPSRSCRRCQLNFCRRRPPHRRCHGHCRPRVPVR